MIEIRILGSIFCYFAEFFCYLCCGWNLYIVVLSLRFQKAVPVKCPGVMPHTDLQIAGDRDLLLHKHIFQSAAAACRQDEGGG